MKIAARRLKVNDEAKNFFKPARFMSTDTYIKNNLQDQSGGHMSQC